MFEISDATTAKASVTPTNNILISTSTSFVLVLFYQKFYPMQLEVLHCSTLHRLLKLLRR